MDAQSGRAGPGAGFTTSTAVGSGTDNTRRGVGRLGWGFFVLFFFFFLFLGGFCTVFCFFFCTIHKSCTEFPNPGDGKGTGVGRGVGRQGRGRTSVTRTRTRTHRHAHPELITGAAGDARRKEYCCSKQNADISFASTPPDPLPTSTPRPSKRPCYAFFPLFFSLFFVVVLIFFFPFFFCGGLFFVVVLFFLFFFNTNLDLWVQTAKNKDSLSG